MNVVRIDERVAARPDAPGVEGVPSAGERTRLLMREARAAAIEQLETLAAAIKDVRALSLDVLQAGDVHGVGVRELTGKLAEDLLWRSKSLEALTARQRAGLLAH